MPAKKKTDDEQVEEPEVVEQPEETPEPEPEPVKPQHRDPTEAQAREAVRRLSPAGVAMFRRILDARGNRLGRDRTGKRRL